MKFIKNIFRDLYIYLLFCLAAWVFVGFVFGRIEYEPASRRVVICAEADMDWRRLSAELEKNKPEGIKQIRGYSIDYFMFDDGTLATADMFIFKKEKLEEAADMGTLLEIDPNAFPEDTVFYAYNGKTVGLMVKGDGIACGAAFIDYPDEDMYLCFHNESLHLKSLTGRGDDAAMSVLKEFLKLK